MSALLALGALAAACGGRADGGAEGSTCSVETSWRIIPAGDAIVDRQCGRLGVEPVNGLVPCTLDVALPVSGPESLCDRPDLGLQASSASELDDARLGFARQRMDVSGQPICRVTQLAVPTCADSPTPGYCYGATGACAEELQLAKGLALEPQTRVLLRCASTTGCR